MGKLTQEAMKLLCSFYFFHELVIALRRNPCPFETLIGALSTPLLRPELKARETMRAGECGETEYDTFMTLAELC
jgi:hypothetical protein